MNLVSLRKTAQLPKLTKLGNTIKQETPNSRAITQEHENKGDESAMPNQRGIKTAADKVGQQLKVDDNSDIELVDEELKRIFDTNES